MNQSASRASITTTTNATANGASIVAQVCRIFLGKDALVTSHNANGGGHDKPKWKRKKKWPTMAEFEFGV